MRKEDVVELSHKIIKSKEFFKLETKLIDVTRDKPEVKHRGDVWYVSHECTFNTHVGTHIEAPYHHRKDGTRVMDLDISHLIAEAVVLDFSHKKIREPITLAEIKKHDAEIKKGCILLIYTDTDKYYGTPQWEASPYLENDALLYLLEKGIACFGSDSASLEVPDTDFQPNHTALFNADVPMIESLCNLKKILDGEYIIFMLPIPIEELEASPMRVVAIRKDILAKAY
jgi:arylformamidase